MARPLNDDVFEAASPRLRGLAYRILGSRADAEDAVQDTYLKWAGKAREGGLSEAAELIEAVASKTAAVTEDLEQALKSVGQ